MNCCGKLTTKSCKLTTAVRNKFATNRNRPSVTLLEPYRARYADVSCGNKSVLVCWRSMSASATGSDEARNLIAASSSSSPDRFRFLRSLRDALFGRRRRAHRPSRDGAAVPRVKSSRSLDDELDPADNDAVTGRLDSTTRPTAAPSADLTRHNKYNEPHAHLNSCL